MIQDTWLFKDEYVHSFDFRLIFILFLFLKIQFALFSNMHFVLNLVYRGYIHVSYICYFLELFFMLAILVLELIGGQNGSPMCYE
jgi:hypothetical protein